jgi:hypothetical protein
VAAIADRGVSRTGITDAGNNKKSASGFIRVHPGSILRRSTVAGPVTNP